MIQKIQFSIPTFLVVFTCSFIITTIGHGSVSAASLNSPTYSCRIPYSSTNWDSRSDTLINSCNLQKFDPGLGSLQQARLTLTQTTVGSIGVENITQQPQNISINAGTRAVFYDSTDSELAVLNTSASRNVDLPPFDAVFDYGGQSGQVVNFNETSNSSVIEITSQGDLENFVSAEAGIIEIYPINVAVTDTSKTQPTAGINTFYGLDAQAHASIVYIYQANNQSPPPNQPSLLSPSQNPPNQNLPQLGQSQTTGNTSNDITTANNPAPLTRSGGSNHMTIAYVLGGVLLIITSLILSLAPKQQHM